MPLLSVDTPAFVYDESRILAMAKAMALAGKQSGCRMLYSIKALPFRPVLDLLAPWVDGFSVSSLFEARLAAPIGHSLHLTTPGLLSDEMTEISGLCRFLACNSLQQFTRMEPLLREKASVGLRINPGLSFLEDARYNPCRVYSKLGVPLDELVQGLNQEQSLAENIKGLHFHTLFASQSFAPMQQNLALIEEILGKTFLSRLDWVNLGGGYLFESLEDLTELVILAKELRNSLGAEVFFEPGKALVGQAGYLTTSVIDCFSRDGKTVAVMDTTVNHHPEIFEYQRRPEPGWVESEDGETVLLAGCTCLAGDVFGEYRVDWNLAVGDRLVFTNVGAYSLIKANRFNGVNLPSVYAWDGATGIRLVKRFSFEDYQTQWTAD